MRKTMKSQYYSALKAELEKSRSMLEQREKLLDEMKKFSDAISTFVQNELQFSGCCKLLNLPAACLGVGVKTIGEIYEVHFQLPGSSAIRLITVTLSKTGVYPCSIRSSNAVELCKNLLAVQKALANCCQICCFRIMEYASKAKQSAEYLSENVVSMGGVGSNPRGNSVSRKESGCRKR
ncbi:MAG: hypothetical protein K6G91_12820 [Kiritimatiellae bacterium]|nr:hypothetical protein [Kiritimatiellia bacterium]